MGYWVLRAMNISLGPDRSVFNTMQAHVPKTLNARYDNASWTRVAVLRDPVDRFASAYLDKCVRAKNDICPDVEHRLDVRDVLTRLEKQYARDPTRVDRHFQAQANLCDLQRMHTNFAIIPFPRIGEGWASMVKRLPIPSRDHRKSLLHWGTKSIASGARARHRTNSSSLVDYWRWAAAAKPPHPDGEILERIMTLYKDDYDLIRSVRSWVLPQDTGSIGTKK